MIHTIKMVEVNVDYDCEYLQDERFYCEFDGCKRSYKDKKNSFQNILKVIKQKISNVKKNVERDMYLDMNLNNIY